MQTRTGEDELEEHHLSSVSPSTGQEVISQRVLRALDEEKEKEGEGG